MKVFLIKNLISFCNMFQYCLLKIIGLRTSEVKKVSKKSLRQVLLLRILMETKYKKIIMQQNTRSYSLPSFLLTIDRNCPRIFVSRF